MEESWKEQSKRQRGRAKRFHLTWSPDLLLGSERVRGEGWYVLERAQRTV